jgi:hypothetical protein
MSFVLLADGEVPHKLDDVALRNSPGMMEHHDAMQRMIDDESIPFGTDFNYDLDAMKLAVESPTVKIPKTVLDSVEEFDKWLQQDDEKLSGDE